MKKTAQTKITTKSGKVYNYQYNYQPVWLRPEIHAKLKDVASKYKLTLNKLIEKFVDSDGEN